MPAMAQQQDFEGIIVYRINVESKVPEISNASWQRNLALGDVEKVYIRHGFYRHISSVVDTYYDPKDEKLYFRYKGIDTLFYRDYASDSSKIQDIRKDNQIVIVNNLKCNQVTIATNHATLTYAYTPLYYMNPAYDKHNTLERFDAYMQAAEAVFMDLRYDHSMYNYQQTAIDVQPQQIDDTVFRLPDLPIRKFTLESVGTLPEFEGGIPGYIKYLQTHLKGNLATKYVKLPKGQDEIQQVVRMRFVIDENGKTLNIEVVNQKEVHPKLADEAIRVMKNLPAWKPGVFLGKKIPFIYQNAVTFAVTR
jgi:hypothetical protein